MSSQCDSKFLAYLQVGRHKQQILNQEIAMMSILTVELCAVIWLVYNTLLTERFSKNAFSLQVLTLISLSVLLGFVESILAIIAVNNLQSEMFSFYFGNCGLGMQIMTSIRNMLMYLTILSLAYKYHNVSKQISSIVNQGLILP